MVSVAEAWKLIERHALPMHEEELLLSAALGRIVSADVAAPVPLPVFDNAAMDGYAFRAADTQGASAENPVSLPLRGVVKAGDKKAPPLASGEACRIMTGSALPDGADAVIALEDAEASGNFLTVRSPLAKGRHVRYRGEEVRAGEIVLRRGSLVQPGTVGFLSALGLDRLRVFQMPRISLISTGSELTVAGKPLADGRIYDSNLPMVRAALEDMRIRPVFERRVRDHVALVRKVVRFALAESDIVILMGGVSAGDFDHVKSILAEAGVETVFWKVSQKPGKPLYFGKKDGRLVFGLPGNPASVFTCFYEYVYPAIRRAMGHADAEMASRWVSLSEPLRQEAEKTLFIKARIGAGGDAVPLKNQKSHMLSSFCEADGFIIVAGPEKTLEKDEKVLVHSLPYSRRSAA